MWKWLEDKLGITQLKADNEELSRKVQSYKESNRHTTNRVEKIYGMVREVTTISSDIQYKHTKGSTIFVAGRYRDNDYVRLFNIQHKDMNYLIDTLKSMEDSMGRGYYDAPLNMDITAWIDR